MSPFVVTSAQIDAILMGLVQYRVTALRTLTDMQMLGQLLWDENQRSVNYRHNERDLAPRYEPALIEARLDHRKLYGVVRCYDYQSCEHPGWENSLARGYTYQLTGLMELAHPSLDREFNAPMHDDRFAWAIDSLDQVIEHRPTLTLIQGGAA